MNYQKHNDSYSCYINGKYFETGLNNFEGLIKFISDCEAKLEKELLKKVKL